MLRVLIAQVIAVGFGERGKRAENGSLIGVRVGECCRRLVCTGGTRAAPGGIHRATLPPSGRGSRQLEPPTSRVVTIGANRAHFVILSGCTGIWPLRSTHRCRSGVSDSAIAGAVVSEARWRYPHHLTLPEPGCG